MNDLVTIRTYQIEDKNIVIDLLRLNTPKYFAKCEEEDLHNYLANERELYYVLLYANKIVGCGGINFAENFTIAKISWDILHPDYQGKSLGTQLLSYRLEKLQSFANLNQIIVRTSQLVYKFYEKQGFELLEIVKDYWADGFDMYKMVFKPNLSN